MVPAWSISPLPIVAQLDLVLGKEGDEALVEDELGLAGADNGVTAVRESAFGRGRLDLGDLADRQAPGLQQAVAVDLDLHPLQLRRDTSFGVFEVAGDEDGDRRRALAGQLVGLQLGEDGNSQAVVLDRRGLGDEGAAKQQRNSSVVLFKLCSRLVVGAPGSRRSFQKFSLTSGNAYLLLFAFDLPHFTFSAAT